MLPQVWTKQLSTSQIWKGPEGHPAPPQSPSAQQTYKSYTVGEIDLFVDILRQYCGTILPQLVWFTAKEKFSEAGCQDTQGLSEPS